MSAKKEEPWYMKPFRETHYAKRGDKKYWAQRKPRARSIEVPGAKRFLKTAAAFCERAAVEGNLKTWDGKDVFVQRCVERAIRSFDAAARVGKKVRR